MKNNKDIKIENFTDHKPFDLSKVLECNEGVDIQSQLIENISRDLELMKKHLITDKLKQLGVEFDEEREKRARFKVLQVEAKNGSETYYYNDGSEKGIRIVTIVTKYPKPNDNSIGIKLEHY